MPPPRGPAPGRIAQVSVTTVDGHRRVGSGYLVTSRVVLTAAHVVAGAAGVTLRFDSGQDGEWAVTSTDVRTAGAGDVAVVVLPSDVDGPGVEPALYGGIGQRAAVVECVAVGFPRFKLRRADGRRYRDRVQAVGRIPVLSNSREGTLEVVTDPPEPDPEHSPWEGMSGAAVWSAGRIVGVVSEHHRSDSPGR